MALNLDELLAAADKYPDNVAITIGEGETAERVPLGDLRARFGALSRERDDAAQKGTVLERTLEALHNAQSGRAAGAGNAPLDGWDTNAGARGAADGARGADAADVFSSDDFTLNDPYSKRMLREFQRILDERVPKALKPFQDQTGQAMVGAAKLIAALTAKQEFGEAGKWPEGYTPERAYKEAAEQGYINRATGLPDLKRLHYAVTEKDRVSAAESAAFERGKKEAEKEFREQQAAAQRSRFKVVGGGNSAAGGKGADKGAENRPRSLRDAIAGIELTPEDISAAALGAAAFQR